MAVVERGTTVRTEGGTPAVSGTERVGTKRDGESPIAVSGPDGAGDPVVIARAKD